MKLNSDYILRNVADEFVLIPVGKAALEVKGLINLSESGYFIYNRISEGAERQDLIDAMLEEYDNSDVKQVTDDVDAFLNQMKALKVITD